LKAVEPSACIYEGARREQTEKGTEDKVIEKTFLYTLSEFLNSEELN